MAMFCAVDVVLANYQPLLQLLADVMAMTAKGVCVCVCVYTHTHTYRQNGREFSWGEVLPEYLDSVYLFTVGMSVYLFNVGICELRVKNNG
jgi:hypothetical protein